MKLSADDRSIHNASCENRTPCVVNLPQGGVNGSLNIKSLRNRGSCVIERRLSNYCLQCKTAATRGKRDNDG